ncbi:MAG: hypothetical protein Q4B27_04500 [Candidatus Saccharibacteria bacterium]|nr:hypothetical protein [Candidatus Saccharibacteria bacterium]
MTNDAYHRCVAELRPISSLLGGGNPSNYYLKDLIHAELVTEVFERVDRRRIFRIPEVINYDLLRSDIKNATTKLESRIESQFAQDKICKNMDYMFSDWLVKLTDNVSKYSADWFDEDYEWEHHDNYATSFDEGKSVLAFLVRSIERGAIRDKDFISKISTYRDRMSGFEERLRPLLPKLRDLEFDSFQQDNLAAEWRWWRH